MKVLYFKEALFIWIQEENKFFTNDSGLKVYLSFDTIKKSSLMWH